MKKDNDSELWESIKLWLVWIAVGGAIIFFLSLGNKSDSDYEEAPDYCDNAICK